LWIVELLCGVAHGEGKPVDRLLLNAGHALDCALAVSFEKSG
jgi:hypothetical protein